MVIRWLVVATLAIWLTACNPAMRMDATQRTAAAPLQVALTIPLNERASDLDFVRHLAFSRNGELILAVDDTARVRLYNLASGALLATLNGESRPPFERGSLVKAGLLDDDTAFYLAWDNGLFEIWDIAPTELRFSHHFSGEGSGEVVAANADYIVHGNEVLNRRTGDLLSGRLLADDRFNIGYWLTDGNLLFSASDMSGVVVLNDLDSGTRQEWRSGHVYAAAFTASQRYLVVGGKKRCQVWRIPDPKLVHQCHSRWPSEEDVISVAAHPTEDLFAVNQGDTVQVYTLDPFKRLLEINALTQVRDLALTANHRLVLAYRDGTIEAWNIGDGRLLGNLSSIYKLAVHPKTGDVLVAGYDDLRGDQHSLYLLTVDQP